MFSSKSVSRVLTFKLMYTTNGCCSYFDFIINVLFLPFFPLYNFNFILKTNWQQKVIVPPHFHFTFHFILQLSDIYNTEYFWIHSIYWRLVKTCKICSSFPAEAGSLTKNLNLNTFIYCREKRRILLTKHYYSHLLNHFKTNIRKCFFSCSSVFLGLCYLWSVPLFLWSINIMTDTLANVLGWMRTNAEWLGTVQEIKHKALKYTAGKIAA